MEDENELMEQLRTIFIACRRWRLRLNLLKCVFGSLSGEFAGHWVAGGERGPLRKRVESLLEFLAEYGKVIFR